MKLKSLLLAALVMGTTFMTTINVSNIGTKASVATIGGESALAFDLPYWALLATQRLGGIAVLTPYGKTVFTFWQFSRAASRLTIVDHDWMRATLKYNRDYDYMAQDFENRTGWKRAFKNMRGYWVYVKP
jgi:hypothetical protein